MRKKSQNEKRRPGGPPIDSSASFKKLLQKVPADERYSLCLYVSGSTRRSARAIANIRSVCDEFLPGRYDLTVIDIHQKPLETRSAQIVAAPTLIKNAPHPVRRLIGDLSDRERLIFSLDLHNQPGSASSGAIAL